MKKVIFVLIVALAAGYYWGYDEASEGKANVAARIFDSFGIAKVKQEAQKRDRREREASAP